MEKFEEIVKGQCDENGNIPADKVAKLTSAIKSAVDSAYVTKERYSDKLNEIETLKSDKQTAEDALTAANNKAAKLQTKYDGLKEDFNAFKADTEKKATHAAKETAYRAILKEAGVSERRIDAVIRVSDVDGVELDEKGAIKGADNLKASIVEEWSDFIPTVETVGAATPTPPAALIGGGDAKLTREDIINMDDSESIQKIAENIGLFN